MSILGSIVVELAASTASFTEGMDAAAKSSRRAGREIASSFSELGEVTARAFAPFGEFGAAVSQTLEQIGASAGNAIQSMGKLGGTIGGVTAIGGGAVAALSAVSLGAVALATHTAETIAKLGELSQSSGVSVGALSSLAFAGKSVSLSVEQVASGLEKMDKAVLKAATSPANTTNAFARLGIALRDTSGQIKPTEEIFSELAARFASMPDGISKTGFALEIFGKGGADMIPLLNKGKAGIDELISTANALGVTLDARTVQAAARFTESMQRIEAARQGVANRLTQDLLPALQFLSQELVESFETGHAQELIDKLAELVKQTLLYGSALGLVLKLANSFGNQAAAWYEEIDATTQVAAIKLHNAVATVSPFSSDEIVKEQQRGAAEIERIWKTTAANVNRDMNDAAYGLDQFNKDFADLKNGITATPARTPTDVLQDTLAWIKKSTGDANTAAQKDPALEGIRARIRELSEEAATWLKVSSAGTRAEQLIAEAVGKGNEEFEKLKEQAAKDKINPAAALALVNQNGALIKSDEATSVLGAAIKALNTDLDKQSSKFQQGSQAALALAAAYKQGGAAIATAVIGQQFAEQVTVLDIATKSYDGLFKGTEKNSAAAKEFAKDIEKATIALANNKAGASALAAAGLSVELGKESDSYKVLAKYIDNVSASYLKGTEAVRAARVEFELQKFLQDELSKGVVVTPQQEQQKRTQLSNQDTDAYKATIAQSAAQYDLNALYADEVGKLADVRKAIQATGDSTLLIDAKLFQNQMGLIHQWDDAAIKVGSFGQRFQAVMNEVSLQGKQAGAEITKAFGTAIDGIETQPAKLMTGQKANFKQIFQGLAESVAKAEIQKTFGSITDAITGKKSVEKKLGTFDNPMYVMLKGGFPLAASASSVPGAMTGGTDGSGAGALGKLASALGLNKFEGGGGGASGGRSGGPGGLGGFLSKVFGLATGGLDKYLTGQLSNLVLSSQAAATQTALGGVGSLAGGGEGAGIGMGEDATADLSSLFDFGGFMAAGGDVSPGKLYRVNERNEEYFMPHVSGRISPDSRAGNDRPRTSITQNVTFNVPQKIDLMRKSDAQVIRDMHRQTAVALAHR